jgi:hypothetical protein
MQAMLAETSQHYWSCTPALYCLICSINK